MTVTFEIESDELNANLLQSLRSLFKGKRLKLTVEDESGVVTSEAMKAKLDEALLGTDVYVFKDDEFSSFAENVMNKGIDWLDNFKDNAKR
ncbi:MAG: hypothetical protein MUE30_10765 [Spirosomaceae bacterium]|jgi:hypothetical protein|nr:hypothetical protein [Spirosomataceae bacterium]